MESWWRPCAASPSGGSAARDQSGADPAITAFIEKIRAVDNRVRGRSVRPDVLSKPDRDRRRQGARRRRFDGWHPVVCGNASHGAFRALGCGCRPCRDGREQHRLVRGVHAGAGEDSRNRSHGGAFCLRRRQRILHPQHSPRQRRLRREPTGIGWWWACSSSSVSFMCRRRSLAAIAGRAGFSSARWLSQQQQRPSVFCWASTAGRRSDTLALADRVFTALSSRAASRFSY